MFDPASKWTAFAPFGFTLLMSLVLTAVAVFERNVVWRVIAAVTYVTCLVLLVVGLLDFFADRTCPKHGLAVTYFAPCNDCRSAAR